MMIRSKWTFVLFFFVLIATPIAHAAWEPPLGLPEGSQYHWAFITDGTTEARDFDISYYNNFVTTQANLSGAITENLGINWFVVGSTYEIDARDNVNLSGPIYLIDGITSVEDESGFWNGTINNPINITQFEDQLDTSVWTGSTFYGVAREPLGSPSPTFGLSNETNMDWIFNYTADSSFTYSLYAISEVQIVPTRIDETIVSYDLGVIDFNYTLDESRAFGINESGDVVGYSTTSTPGEFHAFISRSYNMIDLGTLGGTNSSASDLNDSGQVVGWSQNASGETHAFLWVDGMIDLGTLGGNRSIAYDINNQGKIVGSSNIVGNITEHGFIWEDGEMIDLGTLGGNSSVGRGINNFGQVVGMSTTPSGDNHAFLITPEDTDGNGEADQWYRDNNNDGINDLMTDLGTFTGLSESLAAAINSNINNVEIVGQESESSSGYTESYPFMWSAGPINAPNPSDGWGIGYDYGSAWGINDNGQVVGRQGASGETHAFILTENRDLGTLPGGRESSAYSIQQSGSKIAGWSDNYEGEYRAVIWNIGYETSPGTNIQIEQRGLEITFQSVHTGGLTTVTKSSDYPESGVVLGMPGVNLIGPFYDIQTSANFEGSTVKIALRYDDEGMSPADESALKIYHVEDGRWVDRTTWVNTDDNIIYGVVSSFSWLGLGIPVECDALIGSIQTALNGITISGRNPERIRNRLESKIDDALTKFAEEKYEDAINKLSDFKTKILQLSSKGNISQEDADLLVTNVDNAIACMQALIDG